MTSYAQVSGSVGGGRLVVTLQGVNRRHLEMQVVLPRACASFEMDVRSAVGAVVGRGQVSVAVAWERGEGSGVCVRPNLELVRELKAAWEAIGREVGQKEMPLTLFAGQEGVLLYQEGAQEEASMKEALLALLGSALMQFDEVKKREGAVIAQDMERRLCFIGKALVQIEEKGTRAPVEYREKLLLRFKQLHELSTEEEKRALQEIFLLAEKMDISEEIVRFGAHLKSMQETVGKAVITPSETKGKRLEFLLQEMLREINTVGSKAISVDVARVVVDVKCELEKLREQVQNIE